MMRGLAVCLSLLLLASCASAPPPPAWVGPEPQQLVAEIRAAAKAEAGELDVQPLRDPMVEDLRAQAARFEGEQRYADAAAALDKALAISPDDPALLQERAEAAVLQRDPSRGAGFSQRAYELGSKVGPLCRRHWATIRHARAFEVERLRVQARAARREKDSLQLTAEVDAQMPAIAEAQRAIEACTLTGPPRY
jgi:hypothetical protein